VFGAVQAAEKKTDTDSKEICEQKRKLKLKK